MAVTIEEAMRARHMVRRYTGEPLSEEHVRLLEERIEANNREHGLGIRLVRGDAKAVSGVMRLTVAKNVRDYFLMAGADEDGLDERLGYAGADLMLFAQTLGLNTWWVGGTFNRSDVASRAGADRPVGIVAVGHGATQGKPHKTKEAGQVSSYEGQAPAWFERGVEAALLAPTALAKQAFFLRGRGDEVSIECDNGIFSGADTGLVKYHFELGAGRGSFRWA
jgi:nitroreductase